MFMFSSDVNTTLYTYSFQTSDAKDALLYGWVEWVGGSPMHYSNSISLNTWSWIMMAIITGLVVDRDREIKGGRIRFQSSSQA